MHESQKQMQSYQENNFWISMVFFLLFTCSFQLLPNLPRKSFPGSCMQVKVHLVR